MNNYRLWVLYTLLTLSTILLLQFIKALGG